MRRINICCILHLSMLLSRVVFLSALQLNAVPQRIDVELCSYTLCGGALCLDALQRSRIERRFTAQSYCSMHLLRREFWISTLSGGVFCSTHLVRERLSVHAEKQSVELSISTSLRKTNFRNPLFVVSQLLSRIVYSRRGLTVGRLECRKLQATRTFSECNDDVNGREVCQCEVTNAPSLV